VTGAVTLRLSKVIALCSVEPFLLTKGDPTDNRVRVCCLAPRPYDQELMPEKPGAEPRTPRNPTGAASECCNRYTQESRGIFFENCAVLDSQASALSLDFTQLLHEQLHTAVALFLTLRRHVAGRHFTSSTRPSSVTEVRPSALSPENFGSNMRKWKSGIDGQKCERRS
jgi:hypothetical protein